MKVFLIILLLLVMLVVGVAVFFIMTFDINAHKGAIEKQLSDQLGNTVKLGKLSLAWTGRLTMGVDGLEILKDGEKALSVKRMEAAVELKPLLERKIEVPHIIIISPDITLSRAKDGFIAVKGIATKTGAKPEQAKPETPLPISAKISSFEIRDGSVTFVDMMSQTQAVISLKQIDAKITDISMEGPLKFEGKAAFASRQQNLSVSGIAGGFARRNIYLKDVTGTADLGAIEHAALMAAVPQLVSAGVEEGLAGKLKLTVTDLSTVSGKIDKLLADFSLSGGRIKVKQLKVPVENAECSLTVDTNVLNVRTFSAQMANAEVKGALKAENYMASPKVGINTAIKVDGLKKFLLTALGQQQNVDGVMTLEFQGNASPKTWAELQGALQGSGKISLDKGVIVDTNVMADTLNTLSMFPMIKDKLYSMVPENVRSQLGANYTILKPISMGLTVKENYIYFPGLKIQTDFFDISGSGKSSFTGDVSGDGTILFTKEISKSLAETAPPLANMADGNGRIGFPMSFKSGGGKFKVIPDVQYIIRKIAVLKTQELAAGLLKQLSESGKAAQPAQAQSQGQAAAPATTTATGAAGAPAPGTPAPTAEQQAAGLLGAIMRSASGEREQ